MGSSPTAGVRLRVAALVLAMVAGRIAGADDGPTTFDAVRPILNARCLRCHGADEPKAGLDLRTRETVLAGGELGPVVEAGSVAESLLWDLVESGEMPPVGPPLTDDQKRLVRDWIAAGAPEGTGDSKGDPFGPLDPAPIDPGRLDALIGGSDDLELIGDEGFLRRATLDLFGRPPTPEERAAFLADPATDKRSRAIDDLLGRPEFGRAWAAYWSDTIAARVPPPELTFLRYDAFETWLADRLNAGETWDRVVAALLTAEGKVADEPVSTFVAYHQANPAKLASETARVFLGVQLQCAECHDHKFDHWTRPQFHGLAAFFGRTEAKLAQNDPGPTVVKDRGKGEYAMPDLEHPGKGTEMAPTFLDGRSLPLGTADADRRALLAEAVADPANPWFARAFVNRVWGRLTGRGFYEPVDTMAAYQPHDRPGAHDALAAHFAYTNCDVKGLFRLIMNSSYYQRALPTDEPAPAGFPRRLSGDEVFEALVAATGLPNTAPPTVEPTKEIRFPPPPESTRDRVAARYGYDPSLCPVEVARTMGQAMLMMNDAEVQAQIDADPSSGTPLARLLIEEPDDARAVDRLYRRALARDPTDREREIALEHLAVAEDRGAGFEDLLWALLNSAEFTVRP